MSDFEPSDSESDYDENEKILLQNYRKKKYDSPSESEEEIFNVGADVDESDDDDEELADSDVEGQDEEAYLPSDKDWGKDKKAYYSTDYVDPDYGGFDEKDAQLAQFEEEESKKLHTRFAQRFEDDNFGLDFLQDAEDTAEEDKSGKKAKTEKIKREKIRFLKDGSPELSILLGDFNRKVTIYKTFLRPILAKYRTGQISNCSAMEFVQTFTDLILNYCTNIYMYLLLKSNKTLTNHHPVIKRLHQYRQLLVELEPVFNETVKPQIEILLEEKEQLEAPKEVKKKKLKLLEKLKPSKPIDKKKKKEVAGVPKKEEKHPEETEPMIEEEAEPSENETEQIQTEDNELGKRGITYQIAKNKGLTPHRKKEQRNPRVKHRNKFRKAKIRRKGAVREVRNELQRYGGEISGIKATVTKSIKLKS